MKNNEDLISTASEIIPTFHRMKVSNVLLHEKISKFSELELGGQDPYTAMKTMLLDERLKLPPWVLFFAMYGMIRFRHSIIRDKDGAK